MNLKQCKKLRWLARGVALGLPKPTFDPSGVPSNIVIITRQVARRAMTEEGKREWRTFPRSQVLYHRDLHCRGLYKNLKRAKIRVPVKTAAIRQDAQGQLLGHGQRIDRAIRQALRFGALYAVRS